MQRVILRGVDVASARDAIGTDRYAEGTEAARQRAVIQLHWNPSEQVLTGTVRDGNEDKDRSSELRTVSAEFRASAGFPLRFRAGYCSCAVGVNCRHVAALVVTATDESVATAASQDGTRRNSTLPWEEKLDSLLAATRAPAAPGLDDVHADGQTKLAIELALVRQLEPRYSGYTNGRYIPPFGSSGRAVGPRPRPPALAPGPQRPSRPGAAAGPYCPDGPVRRLDRREPVVVPYRLHDGPR